MVNFHLSNFDTQLSMVKDVFQKKYGNIPFGNEYTHPYIIPTIDAHLDKKEFLCCVSLDCGDYGKIVTKDSIKNKLVDNTNSIYIGDVTLDLKNFIAKLSIQTYKKFEFQKKQQWFNVELDINKIDTYLKSDEIYNLFGRKYNIQPHLVYPAVRYGDGNDNDCYWLVMIFRKFNDHSFGIPAFIFSTDLGINFFSSKRTNPIKPEDSKKLWKIHNDGKLNMKTIESVYFMSHL